jgi:hypothetical protein
MFSTMMFFTSATALRVRLMASALGSCEKKSCSAAHDHAATTNIVLDCAMFIIAAAWRRCHSNDADMASRQLTMRCASTGAKASFRLNASAECAPLPCSSRNRCRTSSRKAYGSRRPSGCSPHAQVLAFYPTVASRMASRLLSTPTA